MAVIEGNQLACTTGVIGALIGVLGATPETRREKKKNNAYRHAIVRISQ